VSSVLYMAWRYLAHHRYVSAVLLLSITLIVYIPVGLRVLVRQSQAQLTARAAATPLLVGARGSPLELVLNALYFDADAPETIPYREAARVARSGLAEAIPLSVRFHAGTDPVVGTTLDYFDFRGLRVAAGHQMTRLGDCVVGARVARARGLAPGGHVITSPESVFDIAGVYPLKMRVTGVLAPSDSPDDDAVFVDVKTTWVIEGLGHGHEDLARPEAAPEVLRREENVITANESVVEYNEITDENVASFHFHGDMDDFPITAVIAVPRDERSAAILMGRYLSADQLQQIVRPAEVIAELLATILTVQSYVVAAVIIVGAATLATAGLVVLLSLRLRRREIETMVKIGGTRRRVAAVLAAEVVGVAAGGVALALVLTWMTSAFGSEIIRSLILG
jgi:putative ABC transport system permease protein